MLRPVMLGLLVMLRRRRSRRWCGCSSGGRSRGWRRRCAGSCRTHGGRPSGSCTGRRCAGSCRTRGGRPSGSCTGRRGLGRCRLGRSGRAGRTRSSCTGSGRGAGTAVADHELRVTDVTGRHERHRRRQRAGIEERRVYFPAAVAVLVHHVATGATAAECHYGGRDVLCRKDPVDVGLIRPEWVLVSAALLLHRQALATPRAGVAGALRRRRFGCPYVLRHGDACVQAAADQQSHAEQ
jgi:hypothetical protein